MDRLEEFVVLADCLNYSRAAGLLFLTQPVLSRHIRDLEESLGVRLFARDTHKVTLTATGEAFAREARDVLDAYHKAMRSMQLAKENLNGRIAVGILGRDARIVSAEFIHYLDASRKLQVDYTSSSSMESLLRLLERDALDLAFVVDVDREDVKGMEVQWIMDDPLYAVVAPDHPLSGRESIRISELSGLPMIVFSRETEPHTAAFHEKLFREHDAQMNAVRTVTNLESGLFYASLGIGFFLIPRHRASMAGNLVMIPFSDPDAHATLSLIWKKNRVNPAITTYVQELMSFYHPSEE